MTSILPLENKITIVGNNYLKKKKLSENDFEFSQCEEMVKFDMIVTPNLWSDHYMLCI